MLKKIAAFIVFSCLIGCFALSAQETRLKFIGFETGGLSFLPEYQNFDFIRGKFQTVPYDDYYYFNANYIKSDFSKYHAGINVEVWSKSNWFGVTTGLRYNHISSNFSRMSDSDFFYVLLSQQGTITEYVRVREFSQRSNYLGIPLALKCHFMKFNKFRAYGKATIDVGFLLNSNSDVEFINPSMKPNEDVIIRRFGNISKMFSSFSWSSGIGFGEVDKVNVNLEVIMPSGMLIQKSSSLVEPEVGVGAQFIVQIPF